MLANQELQLFASGLASFPGMFVRAALPLQAGILAELPAWQAQTNSLAADPLGKIAPLVVLGFDLVSLT